MPVKYRNLIMAARINTNVCTGIKVHPCTGTEALYRPYGP